MKNVTHWFVLIALGLAGSAARAAEISVNVSAQNPLVEESATASSGAVEVEVVSEANSTGGSARASAFASFGSLSVFAISFTNSGADGSSGGGHAIWLDMITINAPGLNGTAGFIDFSLSLQGTLSASVGVSQVGSANAAYSLDISFDNVITSFAGSQAPGGGPPNGDLLPLDASILNQAFTFGVPFRLEVDLGAGAGSGCDGNCGQAVGEANLQDTLNWGGISEVRDSNGGSVTSFTLSSDSGTDWTQPIPEPSVVTLIFLALIGSCLRYPISRKIRSALGR